MSNADRNDPELSRQDQVCAPAPAARKPALKAPADDQGDWESF
jgi:hypothetical protein